MSTEIRLFRAEPGATVNLAVGTTSTRVQVWATPPSEFGPEPCVVLTNTGTIPVFFEFGGAGVTASLANDMPLLPNQSFPFRVTPGETHVAAIATASGATLYATPGYGA